MRDDFEQLERLDRVIELLVAIEKTQFEAYEMQRHATRHLGWLSSTATIAIVIVIIWFAWPYIAGQ